MNKALDFSRCALFVVYFWFGALKVFGQSPASPMVLELLDKTLPFMDPSFFLIMLGVFEVLIGLLFLIPRSERLALTLLAVHMVMVWSPLVLLPALTWQGVLLPTLEGQYIIKNILIIAIAYDLYKSHGS